MVKKICVVTGSRAEYGLLRWVVERISNSKQLKLQLVVTGSHLSHEFGYSVEEIERDGFNIDYRVETLLSSDTSVGVSKSIGLGVIGFSEVLEQAEPDLVLVLGDRYEILAAATAAMIARVPIAHIHGGELTEGAVDDVIRHAITKMSHLHFVATDEYRKRVIQMGEQPSRVFNVGGLGVESVRRTDLMSLNEIEASLGIELLQPSFLVTYHPATLEQDVSADGFRKVLDGLRTFGKAQFLFTIPNADTEGRIINSMIKEFCAEVENAHHFDSLGRVLYLSTMAQVSAVVGNSSSGLLEAPAMGVPTINIGNRQKRRLKASSVIDCELQKMAISQSLAQATSEVFLNDLINIENPYGSGQTSEKILSVLEKNTGEELLLKEFNDL